jgi:molybdate transport system substrate-binding protein
VTNPLEYTLRTRLIVAAACALALSGCGGSSKSSDAVSGTIVVDAASSLKDTFTSLGKAFEAAHPGTKVTLNFGGSDTLAAAITGGAPVDVFAAASTKTMTTVTAAGKGVGTPATFAKNELEIAVPSSNPAKIGSFADTVKSGVKLVTCAATVPCGAAATKAYAAAKLTPKLVSLEPDVKSVLTKVELNEADAGIVYQTDVLAAGAKVTGINFPEAAQAIASYPIVEVKGGKHAATAKAFIALVTGTDGQAALAKAGFQKP